MRKFLLTFFILFLFLSVPPITAYADYSCNSSGGTSFPSATSGGIFPDFSFEAPSYLYFTELSIGFRSNTAGTYQLQYSVDGGNFWQSYQATPSATYPTTDYNLGDGDDYTTLLTQVIPTFIIPDPVTQDNIQIRVLRNGSPYGFTMTNQTITGGCRFPITHSYISTTIDYTDNTQWCPDIPIVGDLCKLVVSFFVPPDFVIFESKFADLQTLMNTKIPFAYISPLTELNLSSIGTSTETATLTIPINITLDGHTYIDLNMSSNEDYGVFPLIRGALIVIFGLSFVIYMFYLARRIF